MRPQKVEHQQLMEGLMSVLRSKGLEGASLMDLSEATGLKKASLYHRFPGGKKEMVDEVLKYVGGWNKEHILNVLTNAQLAPKKRLSLVLSNINSLYNDGESICILRALSTDSSLPIFAIQIEESFKLWIDGFTQLGLDLGMQKREAQKAAQEVLVRIQGSLILSKGLNDLSPFQENLIAIKKIYQ